MLKLLAAIVTALVLAAASNSFAGHGGGELLGHGGGELLGHGGGELLGTGD